MAKTHSAPTPKPPQDRLSLRIDLAGGARIGSGKVAVLEAIARTGSNSGAGRALGMPYRRTWRLVAVSGGGGGPRGGGLLSGDRGRQ